MRSMLPGVLLVFAVSNAFAQATWVVDPAPFLDVTGVSKDGATSFSSVAGGIRLSDGRLLIADRSDYSVRVLDATGKLLKSVGRSGDGPGEFRSMIWAGRCGADSLLVWDLSRRQATMIGSSGTIARQFAVPAAGDSGAPPYQFSCSSRCTMAYLSSPRPVRGAPQQDPNIVAITAAVYRIRPDGSISQRFGTIPAGEAVVMGGGGAPRPLGRSAAVATLDDAVVISVPDSAVVRIVRGDDRATHHSLPISLRAPTRAEYDAAIQATASMVPPQMRQAVGQQLSTVPAPGRLPPISALFADSEGLVWVQTTPSGARTLDFLVMQADGKVVARAQVPRGISLFEIGREYMLGSYTDEGDEPHVVMYRLRRN